jgi:hypothetical protein
MVWTEAGTAVGVVPAPRGRWFDYKITRGDWCTVEKGEACAELADRYGLGAATPARVDRVAAWRDGCDPCP